MHRNRVLYTTLFWTVVTSILYFFAVRFYLFWTYWWYDVMMHLLVAMTGGFGIYWGLFHSGLVFRGEFARRSASVFVVFLCVMAIGAGWELWEYVNGITDSTEGYALDTVNDLFLDGAGALLAALMASRQKQNGPVRSLGHGFNRS